MKNFGLYLLIFIAIIGAFLLGKNYSKSTDTTINYTDSINFKLDKIERVLNKNDSIKKVNDSIDIRVITVEKVYEKTINNIINNTPDDDYAFFSAYTERYCGYNYSDSIEGS